MLKTKCHNCKGKGKVDGGASYKNKESLRVSNCFYCRGTGMRDLTRYHVNSKGEIKNLMGETYG